MRKQNLQLIIAGFLIAGIFSCKKDSAKNNVTRTVQFELFTTKDFSNDDNTITFTLHIRNENRSVWDSVLAPMKIKDIPGEANKLKFEKVVPNDDGSDLSIGFLYKIQNVGESWYFDTMKRGNPLKLVSFDFR